MRATGGDGIAANMALTIAGDTANKLPKLRGLFTSRGTQDLGDVAMLLREQEGFDVRDGERLSEMIRDAAAGDVAVSMERMQRDKEADQERQHRDMIRARAKRLGVKTVAVKLSDMEANVLAVEQKRHDIAVAKLEARDKERFGAALSQSESLVSDDEIRAILKDLEERGIHGREKWREALVMLRQFADDARAKEQDGIFDDDATATTDEPEWFKDFDEEADSQPGARGATAASDAADEGRSPTAAEQGREHGERGPVRSGSEADSQSDGQEAGFELAGQSSAEIAADEAAKVAEQKAAADAAAQEAKDKKAVEQKALAEKVKARAADPDNFLFGEDSKAAANPTGGLFDQPAQQSAPKIGDLVKLTKPGVNGRVNIAGTITRIMPDGRLEVRTQQDGYMVVGVSELGHKAKPAQPANEERAPQEYAEGDKIRFTPHDASKLRPVVEGILVQKANTNGGNFRLRIRTDTANEHGGGSVTPQVYSQNGTVEKLGDGLNAPRDRLNMTPDQAAQHRIDMLAADFTSTIYEESKTDDFDPAEVPAGARDWAKDAGVDERAFLESVVAAVEKETFRRKAGVLAALRAGMRAQSVKPEPIAEPIEPKPTAKPELKGGSAKTATINDFGEKLEGARKDYAAQMKEAMDVDVASQPLSKSWPEPDYQKLLDGGADPYMVAFIRAARDELPTKPQKSWKLAGWVKQAEILRGLAQTLLSGNVTADRVKEIVSEDRLKIVRDAVGGRAELYELVGHGRSLKGVSFARHHFSLYKGQKNVSKWIVEQKAKATAFSSWPRELAVGDTKEEALEAFKGNLASMDFGREAKRQPQFVIYRKRGEPGAWVGKKIGREYVDLHKAADVVEARKYMDENLDALESALAKYKDTPLERRADNQPRVGDDHRNGSPVTPDVFSDTFGFRGVQFGNYVEQARRQSDLNEAFDGLMDLAAVLGVPPRALSLNGQLGLAFGSRGKGGKNAPAAHFEPGRVVINLTKGGGPGSLAHEWWHSLDNYFAKQADSNSTGFVTDIARTDGVRDEMRAAFGAVKAATSTAAYKRRSAELDKRRSKAYWNNPEERSARAFEGYIIAKLFDQGASNDYLANVISNEAWDITEDARAELFGGGDATKTYPYPTVDEMPVVRAAFDEFFKTVQTKESDDGDVMLFNAASAANVSPADSAIFDMAAEGKSAADILDFISNGSRRGFNRYLARALKNLGVASTVKEDRAAGGAIYSQTGNRYGAAYNHKTDTVSLFERAEAERHALHEFTHAGTIKAIAQGGPVVNQLRALFEHVKANGLAAGQYGLTLNKDGTPNLKEFVAEAFSNPKFQALLKRIAAPRGSGLKSAWQAFVRMVSRILGFKSPQMETSLDEVMRLGAQLMRANAAITGKGEGTSYAIAHHGTPHLFAPEPGFPHGRFRLDKMGSGEGAQVYGWGVYLAESDAVAHRYREILSNDHSSIDSAIESSVASIRLVSPLLNKGPSVIPRDEIKEYIRLAALDSGEFSRKAKRSGIGPGGVVYVSDHQNAIKEVAEDDLSINRIAKAQMDHANSLSSLLASKLPRGTSERKALAAKVDASSAALDNAILSELREKISSRGYIFRLDIPDDVMPKLLDWDKPLSEQPAAVQKALSGESIKNRSGQDMLAMNPTGEEIVSALGKSEGASERLAALGIPGLRYLDGNSRNDGEGSHNYVIWDQPTLDRIALLERNGEKLDALSFSQSSDTINVDGVERPRTNSNGKPIAGTDEALDVVLSGKSPMSESRVDSLRSNSESLRNVFKKGAFLSQGYGGLDIPSQRIVLHGVLSLADDQKVLDSVVDLIPVDVMNILRREQLSPYSIFNNESVLKKVLSSDGNGSVSVAVDVANALVRAIASVAAKNTTTSKVGPSYKIGPASTTSNDSSFSDVQNSSSDGENPLIIRQSIGNTGNAGNTGEFSPDNPDISFNISGASPAPAAAVNPWQKAKAKAAALLTPGRLDRAIYELQDKFIDLRRLRDHIKAIGGAITDMNDAYLGEELYHKRLAHRVETFAADELQPLMADMRSKGVAMDEFETFLHARHAPEANAEMAGRNPNQAQINAGQARAAATVRQLETQLQHAQAAGTATAAIEKSLNDARGELSNWNGAQAFQGTEDERRSLSGMSDAAAAAVMSGLSTAKRAKLDALAVRVDAINAGTVKLLDDYGLMSKDALRAWQKTYRYYIPLHRDEAHPDSNSHPIGQGFSTKGDASKRRTGSNAKVTNILGHIAMQRESALTRGEKNHVMLKLYLMARQNPLPDVWKVGAVPTLDVIDKKTGFVKSVPDPLYKNRPNIVMLRIAGKDVAITMNESNPEALRMAQALKNLDVDDLHYLIPVVGKATRYFAAINTQYNPIFGLINLLRDTQEAALNLSTTPIAGKQGEVLRDTLSILKEVLKNKGRMPKTGQWATLFNELREIGGTTGYRDLFLDAESRSKALLDDLKSLDRGNAAKAWNSVKNWLGDYNEAMENATRLAAYKAALDSGMSKERAASLAKNLTVNFNRKGRQTRELGALYAFFNAAVQGSTRMVKTLSGPAGRKIMAGGVMLGAMNTLIGFAAMGGGDDGDDEWSKIPEFVKERSIIIPIGNQDYITIPMPLGFQFLPNIGRLTMEMAIYKDKTAGKQMASLFSVLADAFNPLGGSSPPLQIISPTVMDPFVALAQNRDWTGNPIYRENYSGLDPTPGFARAKDSATPIAKGVAEAINYLTGGTRYTPGGWSPTPDQIDYVFGQLTGGVGREIGKATSTAAAPFTGEELPAYKIPLVGRLYGNTKGASGESQKFYENITRANEAENEIKGRLKAGLSVTDFLQDNPTAMAFAASGNAAERQARLLRSIRRGIVEQDPPDKAARVREINNQIAAVMRGFNRSAAVQ
jgi:hypothetical protein